MTARTQADNPREVRTSVFISHSRKDKDFIGRLKQALEKRGYDIWVDVEDILPTEDWLAGVYSGIEGADAFIFVISPDSVRSDDCQSELDHAVENNKRLIPIVYRTVSDEEVPKPLRVPEWIVFRDSDDFAGSLQTLTEALDTDLEWRHAHTRLQTRAIEWNANGRDSSFVLRGTDLQAAEEWQVRAADKEPKLTALQTEYILAGRNAVARRQRITLGAVTIGFLIAVVLVVIAIWQWRVATAQRNEAERQANIALARQLAAQSEVIRGQQVNLTQRSVLLAVESMRRFPSVEADQALRGGLALLLRGVSALPDAGPATVLDVAYAPDGEYLATASEDGTVRVRELPDGREVAHMKHGSWVQALAFSPNGDYLATASEDGTARVWDLPDGQEVLRVQHKDWLTDVDFSPNGEYLATASEDGTARVWERPDGQEVLRVEHEDYVEDVVFSPNGRYLATASEDGTARVWEAQTGKEVARMDHEDVVEAVAFSPNGEYLATGSQDGTARVWEAKTATQVARMDHEDWVTDVDFSPSGEYLATATDEGLAARVWELPDGREVARANHENWVETVAFSPDGDQLVTGGWDGNTHIWEATGTTGVARVSHEEGTYDLAFTPGGKYLATATADGTARVWELPDGREVARVSGRGQVPDEAANRDFIPALMQNIALSAGAEYLAVSTLGGNSADVWELPDGREVVRVNHKKETPLLSLSLPAVGMGLSLPAVALSPDGDYLATVDAIGTLQVWELPGGHEVARVDYPAVVGGATVVFSPDGKYLAAVMSGIGTVRVWELPGGREVSRVKHEDSVDDVMFSPNGNYLATASEDNTARVWELPDGREVSRVKHEDWVEAVAFSPNGDYLATAGDDGTARVWELPGGGEVSRISFEGTSSSKEDSLDDLAFVSGGEYLAIARVDGTAQIWHWRPQDLIDEACSRLSRNLTREEWQLYLEDEAYRKTCRNLPEPT